MIPAVPGTVPRPGARKRHLSAALVCRQPAAPHADGTETHEVWRQAQPPSAEVSRSWQICVDSRAACGRSPSVIRLEFNRNN
jgi:hypothetical protein